jgi:hypothetical protein
MFGRQDTVIQRRAVGFLEHAQRELVRPFAALVENQAHVGAIVELLHTQLHLQLLPTAG